MPDGPILPASQTEKLIPTALIITENALINAASLASFPLRTSITSDKLMREAILVLILSGRWYIISENLSFIGITEKP